MATDELHDFLSGVLAIRDNSAGRARQEAAALVARNTATGRLLSGATLAELAAIIEVEFDRALTEILDTLKHLMSVPGIDYQPFRDLACIQAHNLSHVLREATNLDKWLATTGRGSATRIIDHRIEALDQNIEHRFQHYGIGLDRARSASNNNNSTTPTATRLQQRLNNRRAWFEREWFFKWHHIGGDWPVEIDQFDGRQARYFGIAFSGSARNIYWQSITQGVRKEIIDQIAWLENSVRGYDCCVADEAIDQCIPLIVNFAQTIRREAIAQERILRGDGLNFPEEKDLGNWEGADDLAIHTQAAALGARLFPRDLSLHDSSGTQAPKQRSELEARPFQVALSFAGERRGYVRKVAEALAARHVAVFYDEFQVNELWGKDGAEYFHQIYSRDAKYVVMFISAEYVAKAWTRHERRSAISRQMKENVEYILPIRFDDTEVPGLPDTLQYLSAERFTPAEIALEIAKKLGLRPTVDKASDVPPPASSAMSGEVTFDYGAYNGRYVIGIGATTFETAWSKASDTSIHLMNDPPSIHGIAIARGAKEIGQISDASAYDFSSRVRTMKTGEIAVLRNKNNFYAAVQVLRVEDDSRGAPSDALTFRYVILRTGKPNFTSENSEGNTG